MPTACGAHPPRAAPRGPPHRRGDTVGLVSGLRWACLVVVVVATVVGVGMFTRGVVRIQTGYLYHYAFVMLIGAAGLITWFMFGLGGQ